MEEEIQGGVMLWWGYTVRCKLIRCNSVLVFVHSLVYYFNKSLYFINCQFHSDFITTRFLCDEFAGVFSLKPLNLKNDSHWKSSDHSEDWLIVYGFIPYQYISQLIAGIQRNSFTVYIHSLVIFTEPASVIRWWGKRNVSSVK